MQEIKKRFKRSQGSTYEEEKAATRSLFVQQPASLDQPKIGKCPDDIQNVASLPVGLCNDLSHVLPCPLKVQLVKQRITKLKLNERPTWFYQNRNDKSERLATTLSRKSNATDFLISIWFLRVPL